MVTVGVPIEQTLHLHADESQTGGWLYPTALSVLEEAGINHDKNDSELQEICSLRWAIMSKTGRMRTRRASDVSVFKERILELTQRVLAHVTGKSIPDLDSSSVDNYNAALYSDVIEQLDANKREVPAEQPEQLGEQGQPEQPQEDERAARARLVQEGSLRAHAKRALASKAREHKTLLGLDLSPVFEGWQVDVGECAVKPKGAPRGKSATRLPEWRVEQLKEKARDIRSAAREESLGTKPCATFKCELCNEDPPLTSFPQGLISHRCSPKGCIRRPTRLNDLILGGIRTGRLFLTGGR